MSAERVFILLKAYAATRSLSNFDLVEQLCEHVWADLEVGSPEELLLGELLNRFETLVGIERDDDGAIKASAPGPMLPEPVECGVPCASCEALAHVAAQLKSEKDRQAREIVRLVGELEESKAEVARLTADIESESRWAKTYLDLSEAAQAEVERWKKLAIERGEGEVQARAEVAKFHDPACLHNHCVRNLTDAQVAHLFGGRMTEIQNDRENLRAEVARLTTTNNTLRSKDDKWRQEVARLTAALAAYAEAANTCPIMGHPGYQLLGWNRKRLDAAYDAARAALAGEGKP